MIELERMVRARPETVFSYFTDPVRYTAWMGVEAELDATPGGIYRVRVPQGYVAVGEFVEVTPPTRVVFTWGWEGDPAVPPGSSRVEITLTAADEGTVVRLVHTGLPDPAATALHTEGWERYIGRLVGAAEGRDPGPDRV
ncbi:MAG TPA: SRPBCC family protein [Acidimicrobiia bacterium]|nr:SRPBCC family protein [Acidimicrobiia bacterium]